MARVKTRVEGTTHFQSVAAESGIKVGTAASNITVIDASGQYTPRIKVKAGEAIDAGELLYPSGYELATSCPIVKLADADAGPPLGVAWWVADADIADGAYGFAVGSKVLLNQDTSAVTNAGDPLYLGVTAGKFHEDAPTTNRHTIQQVGIAVTKHSATGTAWLCPFYSKATTHSET